MRVLIVTTPLPTPTHPDTMAPLARQIKSLRELGIVIEVLEVRGTLASSTYPPATVAGITRIPPFQTSVRIEP